MKKKIISLLLVLSLIFTLGVSSTAFADDITDKQGELNIIQGEKSDTVNDMHQVVSDLKEQQAEVDKLQKVLGEKQDEIDKTLADIEELKNDMENRKAGLNDRLRVMYKNGSIGYLDVLLGSRSLSEFLSNVEMIKRIYKYDQNVLVELKEQNRKLEEQQKLLREEKKEINEKKAVADEKKQELKQKKEEVQSKIDELNSDADRISSEIAKLQAEAAKPPEKPQNESQSESQNAPQSEPQSEPQDNHGNDSNVPSGSGNLMWPSDYSMITSPFGYRFHPVTGIWTGHTGVDIGCPSGSPVYAAASGRVIISEWYYGYGNAIVIDHGDGLSTLYGHNSSLNATVGQTVEQGQVIAYSGSTGISTGPHLHFEVRVKGNYVDPMNYF